MTRHELRELVEARLGRRWEEWAKTHPHLAAAIDRTKLIESTVSRLSEDAGFQDAVARAEADRLRLEATAGVVEFIERLVSRVLRL